MLKKYCAAGGLVVEQVQNDPRRKEAARISVLTTYDVTVQKACQFAKMGVIKDRSVPVPGLKLALVEWHWRRSSGKHCRTTGIRCAIMAAMSSPNLSRVCVPAFSNPNERRDFVRASRNQKFPA
jgi:hypothetical protein